MNVIEELITDRSEADVDRFHYLNNLWNSESGGWSGTYQELSEWMNGLRGAYNASDLNRVSIAMHYLQDRFHEYGYTVAVHSRMDWTVSDIPTQEEMNTYLTDLSSLRSTFEVLKDTPAVPDTMEGLTVDAANDIEKILVNINTVIERTLRSFKRSNAFTFWSGNEALPSAESDRGRTWAELDGMEITWENLEKADWFQLGYGRLEVAT